jgi:hypothetical protein
MTSKDKKQYLGLLEVLKKIKAEDRAKIIPYLKPGAVDFIGECTHNVLFTDLGLKNKSHLKKCLKSQCNVKRLITISKKNTPLDKKIAALKQEGKGIGLIASVALPFLLSLFQGRK